MDVFPADGAPALAVLVEPEAVGRAVLADVTQTVVHAALGARLSAEQPVVMNYTARLWTDVTSSACPSSMFTVLL